MRLSAVLLSSTLLATSTLAAHAEINVVASIKPVHSLVAAVMKGAGEPGLIVKGGGSPHTYALRPSEAGMLQDADIVFWIGQELESFLEGPIETISSDANAVELLDTPGLVKLEFREGGNFEAHNHDHGDDHDDDHEKAEKEHDHDHDHDHEKAEAEHDHDHDHDHDHEKAEKEHDHDHDHDHAGHDHGAFDAHIWLDPINAKAMVGAIEASLSAADPDNAALYASNASELVSQLDDLSTELATELEGLSDQGFIVFHDAYHYFEDRFGLEASGSITVSPEVIPGAQRISELRALVRDTGVTCVFAEPQFEPRIVSTVIEGTEARSGVLDPLGASLEPGADLYPNLLRAMATSFKTCLTPQM